MRIRQSLPQPCIPQTGVQVLCKVQWLGAGSWGLWSSPREKVAVDCGETNQGDVREETVVEMLVEESWAAMEARRYC